MIDVLRPLLKNYSRTKRHYLASWMIYNHINLSQKEPYKRKIIKSGSNPMWRQSISVFSFPPSNLASDAAIMAALQYFGLFPYIYDMRYISWLLLWKFWLLFQAFKNNFWGWTVSLRQHQPGCFANGEILSNCGKIVEESHPRSHKNIMQSSGGISVNTATHLLQNSLWIETIGECLSSVYKFAHKIV